MKRFGPLLLAALLLGLTALAVIPTLKAPPESDRLAKAETLIAVLRAACERHRADTGAYAREYADHPALFRDLSASRPTPGWKGPYLPAPLHSWDAAIAARPFVLAEADRPPFSDGFDLDGDGTIETRGSCNVLRFDYAEAHWSRSLDQRLDAGIPGDWRTTGRGRFFGEVEGKPGTYDVLLVK